MTTRHLVDPGLLDFLDQRPTVALTPELLRIARQGFPLRLSADEDQGLVSKVAVSRRKVSAGDGDHEIGFVLYVPSPAGIARGAILHMHGGGYVAGDPYTFIPGHRRMAGELNCIIVSVDYRLAPETPFPGAIHDCYTLLAWLNSESEILGIDSSCIGVMGESAGGGLAASLALLARDRGEFSLAFQHLIYPMIDDRTCIAATPNPHAGEFIWPAESNRFAWQSLLGRDPGGLDVSPYAAASRATDLSGLPPAFICVGALDLFVDENLNYAARLLRAGVPTELHVYPGAYHGFHLVPQSWLAQAAVRASMDALKRALVPAR